GTAHQQGTVHLACGDLLGCRHRDVGVHFPVLTAGDADVHHLADPLIGLQVGLQRFLVSETGAVPADGDSQCHDRFSLCAEVDVWAPYSDSNSATRVRTMPKETAPGSGVPLLFSPSTRARPSRAVRSAVCSAASRASAAAAVTASAAGPWGCFANR